MIFHPTIPNATRAAPLLTALLSIQNQVSVVSGIVLSGDKSTPHIEEKGLTFLAMENQIESNGPDREALVTTELQLEITLLSGETVYSSNVGINDPLWWLNLCKSKLF